MNKLFIFLFCIPFYSLYSQNKTIHGRVISEDLDIMQGVLIFINDTVEVGTVDSDGFFRIEIPIFEKKVSFRYLAFEPTTIELTDSCDNIEVVMLLSSTYDFKCDFLLSMRVNWIRKRRFRRVPKIHNQAFVKGIFETEHTCYNRVFESF